MSLSRVASLVILRGAATGLTKSISRTLLIYDKINYNKEKHYPYYLLLFVDEDNLRNIYG